MNQDLYRIADDHLRDENARLLGILGAEESGLRLAARVIVDLREGRLPDLDEAPESSDIGEWTDWLISRGALAGFQAAQAPALFEAA